MKRKEKVPKCSALNCLIMESNKDDITLFPFPKNQARCKKWLLNGHLQNLMGQNAKSPQSYYLCSRHFDDDQFSDDEKTCLKNDAIPTIFDILSSQETNSSTNQSLQVKQDPHLDERVDGNMEGEKMKAVEVSADSLTDHNSRASQQVEQIDSARKSTTASARTKSQDRLNKSIYGGANTHCQWCSAINCSNNRIRRPDLSFFRFPSEPDRCKKWIMNSQRFDLKEKSFQTLHNGNYTMCAEHFEENCIQVTPTRQRLFKWAVPTIFNFSTPSKKTRKPTPTFPAHSIQGRGAMRSCRSKGDIVDEDANNSKYKRGKTKSLKRNHHSTKVVSDESASKRQTNLKDLRQENLYLSDQLHQITGSRLETMKKLIKLETKIDVLKEHARIDLGRLTRALDISKHRNAAEEFEKFKSVIHLLTDGEKNADVSEGEGTISCDSLD